MMSGACRCACGITITATGSAGSRSRNCAASSCGWRPCGWPSAARIGVCVMDDVLEAARRLIADNYGRTSDILRFARALLAAEKVVGAAVDLIQHDVAADNREGLPACVERLHLEDMLAAYREAV